MKDDRKTVDEILKEHVPRARPEQIESVGERVLYRLHQTNHRSTSENLVEDILARPQVWFRRWLIVAAAAALVLAMVSYRTFERQPATPIASPLAVVEFVDGTLRSARIGHRTMHVSDTIEQNESLRTGSLMGAGIALPDGSRIEMRADSELTLEDANDGTQIRLRRGSIIVNAAKQGAGRHLHVQTRDITILVVGTMFWVAAEDSRSQVGVIEGEVHVRRGDSEISLFAGEQISSTTFVKERFVPEAIAWSRNAVELLALLAPPVRATPPARPQKASFEVASIRKNASGFANGGITPRGDRFLATNVAVKGLILYAYQPEEGQLLRAQIIGAPGWTETDRFDIEAKIGTDVRSTPVQQIRAMVRTLLKERFRLRAHLETRELPVYDLVLVKDGPKLSADQTPGDPRQAFITFVSEGEKVPALPRGAVGMIESPFGTTLTGTAVPISMLLTLLQGRSDRIILDKTGFNGLFDLDFQFAKDSGAIAPRDMAIPFLFTAIQEIGLKLEPAKAPLPVVIVDKIEKPTEN
jgi:uncharacterized protein (TIGR03435 family)